MVGSRWSLTSSLHYFREPDTSDPTQFGPKTLRHLYGGFELSGHFGTSVKVSKRQFGPKCRTVSPYEPPKCLTQRPACLVIFWGYVESSLLQMTVELTI